MDNSGATSIAFETQVESHKRRRRFHPLRNLRRIFRRRSIAHGDAIRPIAQQHQHYYYHHRNDLIPHHHYHNVRSSSANHRCSCASTQCSCAIINFQSIDDDMLLLSETPHFPTSQQYMRSTHHSNAMMGSRRTYYAKAGMNIDLDLHIDCDSDREIADCQRSFSEAKLIDSRNTLSHSHDSVFSESVTASSLSIVLKTELADALRKRNGRSDISEEDSGSPHFPSIPARNASHIAIHGYKCDNHQRSMDLLEMVTPEMYENSEDQSDRSTYDSERKMGSNDIFPPEIGHDSATKLSHSAAKHKMAIRPKKKGPTRLLRKPNEDTINEVFPTIKVNGEFFNSLNATESLVNKSQSLPRGITTINQIMEKHSATLGMNTSKQSKMKSNEKQMLSSRTTCRDYEYEKKHQTHSDHSRQANIIAHKVTVLSTDATKLEVNRSFDIKQDDCTHSEDGFFRRFINRSGRKSKKEQRDEQSMKNENGQTNRNAKKVDNSTLPIKKGTELSILNVLSKARKNGPQIMQSPQNNDSTHEIDSITKTLTSNNDRSHAMSVTQSFLSKEATQSSRMKSTERIDDGGTSNLHSDLKSISSPVSIRQEKSTCYLRFSPPSSSNANHYHSDQHNSTSSPLEKFIRQSHYWSAEMLNTNSVRESSTLGAGTSEYFWPKDNRFMQNSNKNANGWSQCQQKISKISNDHHNSHTTRSPTKVKMVEKSKSFRLYTKNFNASGEEATHDAFKATLFTNMPSLPNLNATNNPSKCDFNVLRFAGSSNGTVNKSSNDHWTPIRSNSSSRISDVCTNKFEINDMNLLPTSKFCSTLSASNEATSFNESAKDSGDGKATIFIGSKGPSFSPHQLTQNPNIHEIEDNIDKIMKSSMVTVLQKSPPTESCPTKSIVKHDERATQETVKMENPPLLRHSTTTSKLDVQLVSPLSSRKGSAHVPEFMRIQLNRIVDVARPKSCIEYSSNSLKIMSNGTSDDDKERRFSNESIEISDRKKTGINVPIAKTFNANLTKSSESLKGGFSLHSRTYSGSTSEMHQTTDKNENQNANGCLDFDSDSECDSNVVIERRKSVSDKKLKFEKQIEKIQAEVKRSTTIGLDKITANTKHPSIEDDSAAVILRNKQTSSKSNDDSTPELMKVFARRSLKIKDTDTDIERVAFTNANRTPCDTNNNVTEKLKNRFNADSDKENTTSGSDSKSMECAGETNDFDLDARVKRDNKEPKSVRSIGKLFNGSSNSFFNPTNISNSIANNNYRNSTAFFENFHEKNAKRSNLIIDKNKSFNIMSVSTDDDQNQKFNPAPMSNKNSVVSIPTNMIGTNQMIHSNSMDENGDAAQHLNGNITQSPELNDPEIEYKGIHERKAEWEKRASAFK